MSIIIRPAHESERCTIRRIVWRARINPTALDWRRFLVAADDGRIVGVGQLKPHKDGSRELASIAVIPARQSQGIGAQLIRALLARETGPLYLVCETRLSSYYEQFGFRRSEREELTPYFRRMARSFRWWDGCVMKRVS
jgi:amino-acid N-acetyltransferase